MRYVIGVDGGGTKTEAVLADESGHVVDRHLTGASNPHAVTFEIMEMRLAEIIDRFLKRIGPKGRLGAVCLGLAGVSSEQEIGRVNEILNCYGQQRNTAFRTFIRTDAEIALMAAGVHYGTVAIAGTGSIIYGITPQGEQYRVGGWGHLLGDEGSGYAVGVKSLQAVMQSYDGVLPATELTPLILERYSFAAITDLKAYIYDPSIRKRDIAEFASLCMEAEQRSDPVARGILESTACELAVLALTLRRKHSLLGRSPIVLSGSLFKHSPCYRQMFIERIGREDGEAQFQLASLPAAEGAARLALHELKARGLLDQ
ncbi:N-acetylglucosamine kinase [Paenibacillus nasutitermitis]|uniref:N-acetylmuramic acid/N-acetylglucosamine kinase n=1 Tax=Paenibacillus nasutitermitis TaxID=1652958 RepID=A0A916Z1Z3_9BACL|nr:ROK family protein [Paenibacillus nasutitermitis]GGD72180.1 N-acetylmuramic acid/N-acetylglucosamine kinase [Paenibacillus nasutitermitis]